MAVTKNDFDTLATSQDLLRLESRLGGMIENLREAIKRELVELAKSSIAPRPRFLTVEQFCQVLAKKPNGKPISTCTVRRWCKEGRIKAAQEGGANSTWLIPYEELDRIHANASMIEPQRTR
jgi:hypothetical protein